MTIPFHEDDSYEKLIVIKTYITLMNLYSTTRQQQVVSLEKPYQKIKGKQAPQYNTGEIVNEVVIPPYDGIILLNTDQK